MDPEAKAADGAGPAALVSVIVVARNEAGNLPRLKRSLDRLARPPGMALETILVDNGSTDGTGARARDLGFDGVLDLPGLNLPQCRNRGAAAARGGWLAYVDADCEVAPDWLTQAAAYMGAPGPLIMGWPTALPAQATWLQRAWHFHWTHKNMAYEERQSRRVIRRESFRLVTTKNMVMNRVAFEQVGGFDERLATGEDTNLVYRADRQGIEVLGVPDLQVVHHGDPATLREFFRQQLWHANRRSYGAILARGVASPGSHAPVFSALFLGAMAGLLLAPVLAWARHAAWPWLMALPLVALVTGPALLMGWRGRSLAQVPALCVLYLVYGVARAVDLLGCAPAKPAWKATAGPMDKGTGR